MTLSNLGVLAARAGDLERSRSLLGDALALFEETDDAPGQSGMRLNLGNIAAHAGEPERARELLEASRKLAERQRLFRCVGWLTLRWPSWRSPTVTPSTRPGCSARRSSACGRWANRWGVASCFELGQVVAKGSLSPARQGCGIRRISPVRSSKT